MIFGFGRKRKTNKKTILRWVLYSLILLILYSVMSGGFFKQWQPVLIIPLAIAVSTQEREFGSAIFGMLCGFMLDTASGNLFGFSSVWLMPCALAASLLVMNLMRPNFINHLWMTAATCFIMGFMEYFFKYFIWDTPHSDIILRRYIIPSYVWAVVFSPLMFILIRFISAKLKGAEAGRLSGVFDEPESEVEKS